MSAIDELRRTMARLRAPDGCPWDREQTHASLVRCLIDEVSELIDTIDRGDHAHMREELGDVLIQIVFHAQIASEQGLFDFDDVARDINDKLVRRHPHVFGAMRLDTSDQVITEWEKIKATERKNGPAPVAGAVFKELPPRLPGLMFAEAVWKQVEKKALPAEGAVDVARVRVRRILDTHFPDHIPEHVDAHIREYLPIRLPRERMRRPSVDAGPRSSVERATVS